VLAKSVTEAGRRLERNPESGAHVVGVEDQLHGGSRQEVWWAACQHLGSAEDDRSDVRPGVADDGREETSGDLQRQDQAIWTGLRTDGQIETNFGIAVP
jgi:hypothetical protein